MSQIINPERRDPSYLKSKADVGLSKVDNFSAIELQDMVHGALREEYAKGDIYGENELAETGELWIPLCKFTDSSSRATITIGFLGGNKRLTSYIRASVKYSILTKSELNERSGGESPFMVELESSSKRVLPGGFQVITSSDGSNILYLYLPQKNKRQNITGITINLTEELVTGGGDINLKTIEYLNHTEILLKSPVSESNQSKYFISFSGTDRDISSFTRSLALYDKTNDELFFPDNFNGEEINISDYDVPSINGVPFTGDKSLTYLTEENEKKNLGDITITAKHSGSSLNDAGDHNWEVLDKFPSVCYKNNNKETPGAKLINRETGTNELKSGLCNIVPIYSRYSQKETDNIWDCLNKLNDLVKNTSPQDDQHVVSIGFLRRYTENLSFILKELMSVGSSVSGNSSIYFVEKEKELSPNNALYSLNISPNYNHYVEYKFSAIINTNTKWKLSLKKESPYFKISCGDLDGTSYTDFKYFHEFNSSGDSEIEKSIRILTTAVISPNEFNTSPSQNTLVFSILKDDENGNEVEETIKEFPISIKLIDNTDSIFCRYFSGDSYYYPKTLFRVSPKIDGGFNKEYEGTTLFPNCIDRSEVSLESSYGLIWENEPKKDTLYYSSGGIIPINIPGKNSFKPLFIKGYTTNPNRLLVTFKKDKNVSSVDVSIKLYVYDEENRKYIEATDKTDNTDGYLISYENEKYGSSEIIEDTFEYEKILLNKESPSPELIYYVVNNNGISEKKNAENSYLDKYSFYLEISATATKGYSRSDVDFRRLGEISISEEIPTPGQLITFIDFEIWSRPDHSIIDPENNSFDLYKALLDDTQKIVYSTYIPIKDFNEKLIKDKIPVTISGPWSAVFKGKDSKKELIYTKIIKGSLDKKSGAINENTNDEKKWYLHLYGIYDSNSVPSLPTGSSNPLVVKTTDFIYENYSRISENPFRNKIYPSELINSFNSDTTSLIFGKVIESFNPKINLIKFGGFIHEKWFGADDYDWWQIPDNNKKWNDDFFACQQDTDMFDSNHYLTIGSENIDDISGFWQVDSSSKFHDPNYNIRFAIRLNSSYSPYNTDEELEDILPLEVRITDSINSEIVSVSRESLRWPQVRTDQGTEDDNFGGYESCGYVAVFEWGKMGYYFNSDVLGTRICELIIYPSGDKKVYYLPDSNGDSIRIYEAKIIRLKLVSPRWNWN